MEQPTTIEIVFNIILVLIVIISGLFLLMAGVDFIKWLIKKKIGWLLPIIISPFFLQDTFLSGLSKLCAGIAAFLIFIFLVGYIEQWLKDQKKQ